MNMATVPQGTFWMGSSEHHAFEYERPAHKVTISSFQIGRYPVTQSDWYSVMGRKPLKFYLNGCGQCPMSGISWEDAGNFIFELNRKYPDKKYRFLTEAEWEYAARWGYDRPWGGTIDEVAWHIENSWYQDKKGRAPHPVGQKKASPLGLFDMQGNVHEWCEDWFFSYPSEPEKDPKGPKYPPSGIATLSKAGAGYVLKHGGKKVLRGGSYASEKWNCGAISRHYDYPSARSETYGLRLACSL